MNEDKLSGFVVQDGRDITCGENKDKVSEVLLSDSECQPYILPLFPGQAEVMMGHNLTWLCKMVGSSKGTIVWTIPQGQELGEGECWQDRACVREARMTISFIHPEDGGDYTCIAKNNHGNSSRTVYLRVKVVSLVFLVISSYYISGFVGNYLPLNREIFQTTRGSLVLAKMWKLGQDI